MNYREIIKGAINILNIKQTEQTFYQINTYKYLLILRETSLKLYFIKGTFYIYRELDICKANKNALIEYRKNL